MEALLQQILGSLNRVHNRMDAQADFTVGLKELRSAVDRLEQKFDQRERRDSDIEARVARLEGDMNQVKKTIRKELDHYRSEDTQVYGRPLPEGGT